MYLIECIVFGITQPNKKEIACIIVLTKQKIFINSTYRIWKNNIFMHLKFPIRYTSLSVVQRGFCSPYSPLHSRHVGEKHLHNCSFLHWFWNRNLNNSYIKGSFRKLHINSTTHMQATPTIVIRHPPIQNSHVLRFHFLCHCSSSFSNSLKYFR